MCTLKNFTHRLYKCSSAATHYKWTAFFIISTGSDGEMILESQKMIREIHSSIINPHIAIVLCLRTTILNLKAIDPYYPNINNLEPGKITTAFYSITRKHKAAHSVIQYIDEPLKFDIRSEDDIKIYFKNIVSQKFRSKKRILFTWDHGSAYGIFETTAVPTPAIDTTALTIKNQDSLTNQILLRKGNQIKSLTLTADKPGDLITRLLDIDRDIIEKTKNILTISEINNAIGWAFKNKKVDVCIMMNCYMQTFDTGLELSNNIRYLVAPVTYMYFNGYNYKKIFRSLSDNPNISPEQISRITVQSYKTKPYDTPQRKKEALEEVIISSVALRYYPYLAKAIDLIAQTLTEKLPNYFDQMNDCRNNFTYIPKRSKNFMIADIESFLVTLANKLPDKKIKLLIQMYTRLQKICVANLYIGQTIKQDNKAKKISLSGILFFFPANSDDLIFNYSEFVEEKNEIALSFIKKYQWDNFVIKFARKAGFGPIIL